MAPPRKRAAKDSPELSSDGDAPSSKRNKTTKSDQDFKSAKQKLSTGSRIEESDDPSWSLNETASRCVNINEFKGMTMVGIREFYEKDGKMLPGKKVGLPAQSVPFLDRRRAILVEGACHW